VVLALFVRELKTHFGRFRLGYLWALLEPAAGVAVLAFIWSSFFVKDFGGVPIVPFLATGMVPFLFFTKAITGGLNSINANMGLFNYRQVRPFDTLVTRLILEGMIYLGVYCVFIIFCWWVLDIDMWPDNLLLLVVVSVLLFAFVAGLAMAASVAGKLFPEAAKLIPMMMRPFFFISGVIFPLFMLPDEYKAYLLWNPLLHAIELSHVAFFASFESPFVSLEYLFLSAVVSLAFGLTCLRASRQRLIST
jgi:capsular polysaccharide transport system permease protein